MMSSVRYIRYLVLALVVRLNSSLQKLIVNVPIIVGPSLTMPRD